MRRHVLTNVLASITLGNAILIEASLSFLGAGAVDDGAMDRECALPCGLPRRDRTVPLRRR